MERIAGYYEELGNFRYYIPSPLPPSNPLIQWNDSLASIYAQASRSLSQLNEMTYRLPDIKRFIKAYVIKEALLSSAIEGIHTTLIDVYTQPMEGTKYSKETQLVLNYVTALDVSLHMLQKDGLPISSRVLLQAHKTLMSGGDGDKASPGHYRKQFVRVGNLLPAPAQHIPRLMTELETFINTDDSLSALLKAGLAHVQFETIHPFLDGNGRIGRLLIVLMLIEGELLKSPILYPSYFFKKNHAAYYQHLDRVRTHGDFEGWLQFYLQGINESSLDAYKRALAIEELEKIVLTKLQTTERFAKNPTLAQTVLSMLFQFPIVSVSDYAEKLTVSYNTAARFIDELVTLEIIQEITAQKRNKLYQFGTYLALLDKEL